MDTCIWVDDDGYIQSTLYSKPCRVVQFLSPTSSHPSHITQNIPYSLAYRLRRIESKDDLFKTNLEKLKAELVQRGYNKGSISSSFNKVKSIPRSTTLEKVVRPPCDRLILVIPYDKRLPNITGILHHRWKCLTDRDPEALNYMARPPMIAYSRTKSLCDILVRSKLPPSSYRQERRQARSGFRKCMGRADCAVCTHSVNSTSHTCNYTGVANQITSNISCTTPGVIYTVSCQKQSGECARLGGPQYVGCTTRPGKVRVAEHIGSVTQPSQANTIKPVGAHFRLPGHSHSDMVFLPIEKVVNKDKFVLESREAYWIRKYNCVKTNSVQEIEHGLYLK